MQNKLDLLKVLIDALRSSISPILECASVTYIKDI